MLGWVGWKGGRCNLRLSADRWLCIWWGEGRESMWVDIGRCRPMLFGEGSLVPEILLTGRRGDEVSAEQSEQHTVGLVLIA